MSFLTFENLPVFKQAHSLTLEVYRITKVFPKKETYGLTSQRRRSAASIASNVVEEVHRNSKKELLQFLFQARAACAETIYHLILAKDLKYMKDSSYSRVREDAEDVMRQLNGWIRSEKKKL